MNDEFEEINGFKPSIRRSQVDEFTKDDAYVLLYGVGDFGHGYHALDAALPGKSTFPGGWGELAVVDWYSGNMNDWMDS